MTSLGIIWLVHWGTGSFGTAGIVAGAFAVTEACAGPVVARLIDHRGQPRVVPGVLAVHGVAVTALVASVAGHAPVWVLVLVAVLAGGSIPQIGALSAARWSWLLRGDDSLRTAFALEAVANDVAFLTGPALIAVVSAEVAGYAGSVFAVSLLLAGGLLFVTARGSAPRPEPPADRAAGPAPVGPGRRGLREPILWVLVVANLGLGLLFGSTQVSVTAFAVARGDGAYSGLLYGLMSLASVTAGFAFGLRRWPIRPETQLLVAFTVLSVGCVVLTLVHSTAALAVALLVPGAAIAPSIIVTGVLTQASVDAAVLTQAFTWQNSASAAGVAVGAACAGRAVDAVSPSAGFVVSAVSASVLTVVVYVWWLTTARHTRNRVETEHGSDRQL
jgi:predicted MFS family arabinose efflux permease